MTLLEAAEYLHCNYATVHRLVRVAICPVFGWAAVGLTRSDIEKWIAERTKGRSGS
jgi:hypothetical protein